MVFVLDGGFSTQLAKYVGESAILESPLWTARFLHSNPDAVIKTHCDFVEAGCDVVLTNTYQASVEGFQLHLSLGRDESLALISHAVNLARQSIRNSSKGKQVLVAGSVGPYGACLNDGSEYRGDYAATMEPTDLTDWHRPRITALVQAKVDLLAIETIPSLVEACSVVEMLKKEFPDQKFWLSFSCKDNSCISDGTKFSEAAAVVCKIAGNQLVAVGVNCISPSSVTPLLSTTQDLLAPYVVYPNRGEEWIPGKGWSRESTSEPLTNYVAEWVSLGARYIGGCCKTTADDMKLICQYIDSHNLSEPDQGRREKVDGR